MRLTINIALVIVCAWVLQGSAYAQYIRVIDNKGTIAKVDSSKWILNGTNIYNKNSGNVGIGNVPNNAKLMIDNGNSTVLPVLKLKYPFTGLLQDSILIWSSADSTVKKIRSDSLLAQAWLINGNGNTSATTNFLGTTNNQDLVFKTQNAEKLRVFSNNSTIAMGLGTGNTVPAISGYSGSTLFFGGPGNLSSPTGMNFIIDNDNNSTNSQFNFLSNAYSGLQIMTITEANGGAVGIGQNAATPQATLHNSGSTILGSLALPNFPANAAIGTAATTVDLYSGAVITQTTASISLTLPNPANATAGRLFQVSNASGSTQALTVGGITIAPNSSALFRWDGASWNTTTAIAGNVPISGLLPAVTNNTIENAAFQQTWTWNGSSTQNPLTISSSGLTTGNLFTLTGSNTATTGSILSLNSNSTGAITNGLANFNFTGAHTGNAFNITDVTTAGTVQNINANSLTAGSAFNINANALTTGAGINVASTGTAITSGSLIEAAGNVSATTTNGLLYINNTSAATTGAVARIQSNTTAGSGVNILANSNVGIGYANPVSPTSTTITNNPSSASTTTLAVNGIIEAPVYTSQIQTLVGGAWDVSKGSSAKMTLVTGANTLTLTNYIAGMYGVVVVTTPAATTSTLTFTAIGGKTHKVINGGNGVPYLTPSTATVASYDILSFYYDGTTFWWTIGNNYN